MPAAAGTTALEQNVRSILSASTRDVLAGHALGLPPEVSETAGHFFDLLAEDVVFEFIITVPAYPRRIAGRDNLIDLYRGYHKAFFLDRCFDLRTHRDDDSTVTLEYASEGRAVATGRPYSNHYVSVVTIKDRKITHWRDYLDPLRVFAALDVED